MVAVNRSGVQSGGSEFKLILNYVLTLSVAWATWDDILNKPSLKIKTKLTIFIL